MSEENSGQGKQGMQHSGRSYPVIKVIYVDGHPVNIRRKGGGTYGELAAAFAQEIIKSLPQNRSAPPSPNDTTE